MPYRLYFVAFVVAVAVACVAAAAVSVVIIFIAVDVVVFVVVVVAVACGGCDDGAAVGVAAVVGVVADAALLVGIVVRCHSWRMTTMRCYASMCYASFLMSLFVLPPRCLFVCL